MGSACCVAARDRTITNRSPSEILQRNVMYSPSWSFRWDNRGRVAGEGTPANWLPDGGGGNHRIDVKSGATIEIHLLLKMVAHWTVSGHFHGRSPQLVKEMLGF